MKKTALLSLVLILSLGALAQDSTVAVETNVPPFGSADGGPFDTINLATLNVHFAIPIFSKKGRGLPFNYALSWDSNAAWQIVQSGGYSYWMPGTNYGWISPTGAMTGDVVLAQTMFDCFDQWDNEYWVNGYVANSYRTPDGVTHLASQPSANSGCAGAPSQTTVDGSGYTIITTVDGNNRPTVTVYPRSGGQVVLVRPNGLLPLSVTDANGNTISIGNNSDPAFTDTLATTALTYNNYDPDLGYASYVYPSPGGGNVQDTFAYPANSTPIQTSFSCGGFQYSGSNLFVNRVNLADGSYYQFGYDSIGRINSVTLPTGGTMLYTYGDPCTNGYTDGAPLSLTRGTPDGGWTYSRAPQSTIPSGPWTGVWNTTRVDPAGNHMVVTFQAAAKKLSPYASADFYPNYYEVSRKTASGVSNYLVGRDVTYTGANSTSAGPSGGTLMLPIAQVSTTNYKYKANSNLNPPPSASFVTTTSYNSYGLPTQSDVWDFNGAHLKGVTTVYATLGNNIYDHPGSVTIKKNGVQQAQTLYTYTNQVTASGAPQLSSISGDRGNVGQVQQWVSGSTYLSKSFTYYDTGNVKTSTDVNGAVTTYSYAGTSCGQAFATGVTRQVDQSHNLTTSAAWNCYGGAQTSATDENGRGSSVSYDVFWRTGSSTDKAGNVTNMSYLSPTQAESVLNFNSGASTVDSLTTRDNLGRVIVKQQRNGPGSSIFVTVAYSVDSSGRPTSSTVPYSAGAGYIWANAPTDSLIWDPANRPSSLSGAAGQNASVTFDYQYATMTTAIGWPGGEPASTKILQTDALGRVASVCEVTSAAGTVSCSTGSGTANGYLTAYTYNALGETLTITTTTTVGTQTRSFTYDGLGRVLTETYPESGTTTYAYDSVTGCSSSAGDRITRTDAVGNVACYSYDLQHRKTSITYSGPYASRTPNRYFVYDSATVNGTAMANAAGRLAEAYTCTGSCTTKITDVGFSYTVRGEASDTYQSSAHSGGYYHISSTYWANGKMQTLSGIPGVPAITYAVDGMGRTTSVSASSGQNPVTSVSYNDKNQVSGLTFGSGDSDSYSYNSSGQMTGFSFNVNGQSLTATIGWNTNGTVLNFGTTDPFNSSNNGTCTFGYDDMMRVNGANCAPTGGPAYWSQVFSFDPFGNISKSGSSAFQPTYSTATNRISSLPGASVSYDANGNLLNDGTYTYDWTAFGKASTVNGIAITYDALGRPVEQNNAGVFTEIVYDVVGAKAATVNGQTLQKGFVRLPAGAIAVYQASGLAWYRHSDNLGSSRLATTPTRAVAADRAYAPYGEAYNETGMQDRSFTGKDEDTVSGIYDFPARRYSPTQGRWLSPDPAGGSVFNTRSPGSLNRYAYVSNNPLSNVDPSGLFLCGSKCHVPEDYDADLCGGGDCLEVVAGADNPEDQKSPAGASTPPRDRERLQAALDIALQALSDPNCAAAFGQDTHGDRNLTARATLISIASGGQYGKINFQPLKDGFGQRVYAPAQTNGGGQQYVPGVDSSSVTITINNGSWLDQYQEGWNHANDDENAKTILHELLHATWLLGFRNQDERVDNRFPENSSANDGVISDRCIHGL